MKNESQNRLSLGNLGNKIIIGKNSFKKELTEEHQIQQKVKEFLAKNYIRFEQIDDNSVKIGIQGNITQNCNFIGNFLSCLVQSDMHGFVFIGIKFPLLKELVKVNFSRLQRLELVNCQINNIEPLTWIDSSYFKSIYLGDNFITSLKPLQKTRFNNFTSIDLHNNYVTQFTSFCRTMMPAYRQSVNNRFYVYLMQTILPLENLNFIFKMRNIQSCLIGSVAISNRVYQQPKVMDAIQRLQTQSQIVR